MNAAMKYILRAWPIETRISVVRYHRERATCLRARSQSWIRGVNRSFAQTDPNGSIGANQRCESKARGHIHYVGTSGSGAQNGRAIPSEFPMMQPLSGSRAQSRTGGE